MSRYAMDKVFREVITSNAAREAFAANAESYLAGRDLTPDERQALITRDFTTLYKMGAHPFLMVGFVATQSPPAERGKAMAAYQQSLAELGYPDYST
ncbi:MAG: hypothetical protein ABSH03_10950 [Candidatus Lustribacter sp.]|jgi:hypothetical protein